MIADLRAGRASPQELADEIAGMALRAELWAAACALDDPLALEGEAGRDLCIRLTGQVAAALAEVRDEYVRYLRAYAEAGRDAGRPS